MAAVAEIEFKRDGPLDNMKKWTWEICRYEERDGVTILLPCLYFEYDADEKEWSIGVSIWRWGIGIFWKRI